MSRETRCNIVRPASVPSVMPSRSTAMLMLPNDFQFTNVTGIVSSTTDGRALEQMHKALQQPSTPVAQYRLRHDHDAMQGNGAPHSKLLMLGIMSGSEARRRMISSTWHHVPDVRHHVQVIFVVGSPEPLPSEWQFLEGDGREVPHLRVNVSEGVRVWRPTEEQRRRHQSFTGTFTTYFKQAAFLRFAATQRTPLIARADDDSFITPHALLAYAAVMQHMHQPFYAGVFEWISWRAARLEATGFSYGLPEARGRAKAAHRNCSRSVPDSLSDQYDYACLGPFAYAKGPLLMMNRASLMWLVHHPIFYRDLKRARDMAEGRAPTRKGRIDDDINLGYWMVRMPDLRVVRLRRVVWKDTWRDGADPSRLLVSHKMPWAMHGIVHNITSTMWRTASSASVAAFCRADAPPCTECSHNRGQRPCVVEITLDNYHDPASVPTCVRAPGKGSGCPKFARESHPSPSDFF